MCSEICTLESSIEVAETASGIQQETEKLEARNRALDFIHDMGWLLHRSHLKFRLGSNPSHFPFDRFRWLIEFSVDRDWCAVVKKLLDILFGGIVDAGEHSSLEIALRDIGLLHRAVRGNCRRMIEALLQYCPDKGLEKSELVKTQHGGHYIFKPDAIVIGGLTPLHIVASQKGLENLLDALTNDPGQVTFSRTISVLTYKLLQFLQSIKHCSIIGSLGFQVHLCAKKKAILPLVLLSYWFASGEIKNTMF